MGVGVSLFNQRRDAGGSAVSFLEIGDALTASEYCKDMATEFLVRYKFKNWTTRQT